jgi:uncharacterized damage-inducible protein DinB
MSWTAPDVDRAEPLPIAAERPALESWLDDHRAPVQTKCAGLTPEQLRMRSAEPSNLSLLGLVRHMAEVERSWFRRRFLGQDIGMRYCTEESPEADLDDIEDADAESDFAAFAEEVDQARLAAEGHSLDETFYHPRLEMELDLRWIYIHMIEEYARHNGHADLLRERIDGSTGD